MVFLSGFICGRMLFSICNILWLAAQNANALIVVIESFAPIASPHQLCLPHSFILYYKQYRSENVWFVYRYIQNRCFTCRISTIYAKYKQYILV